MEVDLVHLVAVGLVRLVEVGLAHPVVVVDHLFQGSLIPDQPDLLCNLTLRQTKVSKQHNLFPLNRILLHKTLDLKQRVHLRPDRQTYSPLPLLPLRELLE